MLSVAAQNTIAATLVDDAPHLLYAWKGSDPPLEVLLHGRPQLKAVFRSDKVECEASPYASVSGSLLLSLLPSSHPIYHTN